MFQHVVAYPGDPILTLNEAFAADPRDTKVNLSIGVYLDEHRRLPLMKSVATAETEQRRQQEPHPYLPMEGLGNYAVQVKRLVFGADIAQANDDRIGSIQTLGGSGALKVGADFLASWFPAAQVWVSAPTWDNHWGIFTGAGFAVNEYGYYSSLTKGVDFAALLDSASAMAAGDIVVLHGCCHNPTGADLSSDQWRVLAEVFRERKLIPIFDIAYQGFGRGIDEDAFAVRHFAAQNIPLLVASSFSKNFALYGERCGALQIFCPDAYQAATVLSQLKLTVRRIYSSPPAFGGRIVATVLQDSSLRALWESELAGMRSRMRAMREGLHNELKSLAPTCDFDYLLTQQGMFSFTGLTVQQVRALRERFGIYLIETGRVCIAALTEEVLPYVAESIVEVIKEGSHGKV